MKRLVVIVLLCAAFPPLLPHESNAAGPKPVTLIGSVAFASPRLGWLETSTSAGYSGYCYRAMPQPRACNRAVTDIYATGDAGHTWRRVLGFSSQPYIGENALPTSWIHAFDARHILVLPVGPRARATLYRTTDGGAHWSFLPRRPRRLVSLTTTDVAFANPSDLWLLAHQGAAAGSEAVSVYRTRDGGRHWSMVACTPTPATQPNQQCRLSSGIGFPGHKDNIVFASPSTGFLTNNNNAYQPFLSVTHDGGIHWRAERPRRPSNTAEYQRPLFFGRLGVLPVTGRVCHARRTRGRARSVCHDAFYALLSRDGGRTWPVTRRFPHSFSWTSMTGPVWQALAPSTSYLIGAKYLWGTADGGVRWRSMPVRFPRGYAPAMMQFVTRAVGWVLLAKIDRSDGVAAATGLFWTKDGGKHWISVRVPGLDS
jgi:photosystem II stability/assembly factor-like uncharacterized protein